MHVVSDLQQRPNKSRLKCEKRIVPFYDICSVVQFVCLVIHTTKVVMTARCTFAHSLWSKNNLELVPPLVMKLDSCYYMTTRSTLYAFKDVSVELFLSGVSDVFADHAIQMGLAIFFCAFTLFFGAVNRSAVENNFFSYRWRNFVFRKDLIAALEIAMLCLVLRTALMATAAGSLLEDYLRYCKVVSRAYLPFCTVVPLFVFVGAGFATYVVGCVLYLYNALPKYGIMTEEEIVDYKVWLRGRRARIEEAKRAAEAAKLANMRLQLMMRDSSRPPLREMTRSASFSTSGQPDHYVHPDVSAASQRRHSSSHVPLPINLPRRRETSLMRQQQQQYNPQQSQSQSQQEQDEGNSHSAGIPLYTSYIGASPFFTQKN
ncbi:uncharacterized protein TM35_000141250 [Trypanosoma theileri]|uniref:Uncharacterized protein n=1 Tax=Trypanosoma theileri TaxID=67003 RepID=A0A1X0NW37_9TRYP|nr:uncharacterized protein TM35_000141250 [Trypanosoma theileri]ORC88914.1 hypothetical protein TM35_000141250 [Trypanosoma theileri]